MAMELMPIVVPTAAEATDETVIAITATHTRATATSLPTLALLRLPRQHLVPPPLRQTTTHKPLSTLSTMRTSREEILTLHMAGIRITLLTTITTSNRRLLNSKLLQQEIQTLHHLHQQTAVHHLRLRLRPGTQQCRHLQGFEVWNQGQLTKSDRILRLLAEAA